MNGNSSNNVAGFSALMELAAQHAKYKLYDLGTFGGLQRFSAYGFPAVSSTGIAMASGQPISLFP